MEVQGRIYKVLPERSGTKSDGSTWKSLEFIVEFFETPDQRWSDKVLLSVMNERIDEYDVHEGDEVRVGFSHNVREYNGRFYPDFRIYKFEKKTAAQQPKEQPQPQPTPAPEEKKDDLPF